MGNFESTGGRKAQAITVNGMSKCAVSVNLSDAGIKVSLVDLKGEIVFSEKRAFLLRKMPFTVRVLRSL